MNGAIGFTLGGAIVWFFWDVALPLYRRLVLWRAKEKRNRRRMFRAKIREMNEFRLEQFKRARG